MSNFLQEFLNEEIYVLKNDNEKNDISNSKSGIYIVSNEVLIDNINTDLCQLLIKILSAVKLSIGQVQLVTQLPENAAGKAVIFGGSASKYTLSDSGQLTELHSDPLSVVAASGELKKSLWVALQKMF